jgi:hypothetical protein
VVDLLAVLIERDPHIAAVVFGWLDAVVIASREVRAEGRDRVDLVVHAGDAFVGVIEVKVLSGLGANQLARYRRALPGAMSYVAVFPRQLPVSVPSDWKSITWEDLLEAFTRSRVPWVAETAAAWREHLEAAMPRVGADTVWNHFTAGEDFVLAMRARSSWVFGQLHPLDPVSLMILQSSSGVSWVVKMTAPAAVPGYLIAIEFEEKWPNRSWPKFASDPEPRVIGPSIKVCLIQTDIKTSAAFDWEHLHALWPTMEAARTDWVTTSARPRAAHDREGWQRIVDAGAPPFLGIGFGEAQTRKSLECMFGARFQLAPDITLADLATAMQGLVPLLAALAAVDPTGSSKDPRIG